jgi:hypothetical protein
MAKTLITPGKLYAKLSAEFRRLRADTCAACNMPMVYVIERHAGDYANWLVGEPLRNCEACEPIITDIVRRLSLEYDIFDPTFIPPGAAAHATGHAGFRH